MTRARNMELRSALAAAVAALTLVGAAMVPIKAQARPADAPAAVAIPICEDPGR